MTILLGHLEAICPKPWDLKHLLEVAGLSRGLFYGVGVLGAI